MCQSFSKYVSPRWLDSRGGAGERQRRGTKRERRDKRVGRIISMCSGSQASPRCLVSGCPDFPRKIPRQIVVGILSVKVRV